MKKYISILALLIAVSTSCSVVKQNGYYQSRKYKPVSNKLLSSPKKSVTTKKDKIIPREKDPSEFEKASRFLSKKGSDPSRLIQDKKVDINLTANKNYRQIIHSSKPARLKMDEEVHFTESRKVIGRMHLLGPLSQTRNTLNAQKSKIIKRNNREYLNPKTPLKHTMGIVLHSILFLTGIIVLLAAAGGGFSAGVWVIGSTLVLIASFFLYQIAKKLSAKARWKFLRVVSLILIVASILILLLQATGWGFGVGGWILGIALVPISIFLFRLCQSKLKGLN